MKFADDTGTKIFSCLRDQKDCDALQDDLDLLFTWSTEWQMQFNIEKCKVMHIGKKNPIYEYVRTHVPSISRVRTNAIKNAYES